MSTQSSTKAPGYRPLENEIYVTGIKAGVFFIDNINNEKDPYFVIMLIGDL